jgi:hypothetical protein
MAKKRDVMVRFIGTVLPITPPTVAGGKALSKTAKVV